ncbi:AhpC-TSA domain-containing protein/1-cysPrx_C domain-containing protein [Cephalotus follicularis]|uniref:Peroxiredoxin n=1 Tax=Cephalotus follicularis TaxID=3775 RepID=A0A1Q3BUS3_CEPFO|nr:AhpC-TSA domain-containing protein/1-cysPrx_C domain-containing protein [Cephalotus follicularis]
MPGLTLGDTIPNLEVDTTDGKMKLHDYIDDSWTILFSHPGDFTPVCTTELGKLAAMAEEFARRGVKLLGLSCDDLLSHVEWIKDIEAYSQSKVTYPIIADPNREIIKQLNMVDPDEKDSSGAPIPSRALHIVGPDKKIKLSFLYPASTGRNMDEVMRVLESLQKASKHKVATPVDWKPGDPVVISPNVSNEEAKKMFPHGFKTVDLPSKKEYLRFTNVE